MSRGRAAGTASPLCFTVPAKGMGSSQAAHPKASLVSLCLVSWKGDTSRAVEGDSLAPRELSALHRVILPLQWHSCALSHPQPLQGAQDQHLSPTHSAPGCHFPHFLPGSMSICCLQLQELGLGGGTYSGWKACISQASCFPQKCLSWPQEGIENHPSLD